jgi:hypothetical protein
MYYIIFWITYILLSTKVFAFDYGHQNLRTLAFKDLLYYNSPELKPELIDTILTSVSCAEKRGTEYNKIVTVIDYSIPANQKRLWVFDLIHNKLLLHTYVSHGIKSGFLYTNNFSNTFDSKSSSIGMFITKDAYYGREGISLKLHGLERDFNDNAANRFIVMHGGWYVNSMFAERYGRIGRSWGCPAVPKEEVKNLINTIKNGSLLLVYYPDPNWLLESKFLSCEDFSKPKNLDNIMLDNAGIEDEIFDPILYVDLNNNNKYEETDPVIVINAEYYMQKLNSKAPLIRMLRRRIDNAEYVVLTKAELAKIAFEDFNLLYFIVPNIKLVHGYYETEMRPLKLGDIKNININANSANIIFQNGKYLNIYNNNKFIRWIGL